MLRLFLLALVTLAMGYSARPATVMSGAPSHLVTISILATSDLHGHLETLPWFGGYVRALREVRKQNGGEVLLVDSGDMWQGTLASNRDEGAAVVRAYNALGYAAVAIGNHEFDFGPQGPKPVPRTSDDNPRGALEARARDAKFPLLTANIMDGDDRHWSPPNIRPAHALVANGVRVGLIGVTTRSAPSATDQRNLTGLRFAPLLESVIPQARRLRAEGASLVVILAHAGGRCNRWNDPSDLRECDAGAEMFELANALPSGLVDVIAGGNTHQGVAHRVNGIAIIQSFSAGRAFGRVDVRVDRASGKVYDIRIYPPHGICRDGQPHALRDLADQTCIAPLTYEARKVSPDVRLARLVRPDLKRERAIRERRIGVTAFHAFPNSTNAESKAGNLVVDLLRQMKPGADVALYHAGGTRAGLGPGPITYGAMSDLLPFDSALATATIRADALARALERALTRSFIPTISGMRVIVSCRDNGPRVSLIRDGREIPPDELLSVVTSEFLVFGGPALFDASSDAFAIEQDEPMREAVIGALNAQRANVENGSIGAFDPARPRVEFTGSSAFHCAP